MVFLKKKKKKKKNDLFKIYSKMRHYRNVMVTVKQYEMMENVLTPTRNGDKQDEQETN